MQPQSFADRCLYVVRLSEDAVIPTKGTRDSVGFDLYSPQKYFIPAGGRVACEIDLRIHFPKGFFGKIESRYKSFITFLHYFKYF